MRVMLSIAPPLPLPSLEQSISIANHEVMSLVSELEPALTTHQASLLHQIRLAAESLGAARATLSLRQR
jgi:hypothetical protein